MEQISKNSKLILRHALSAVALTLLGMILESYGVCGLSVAVASELNPPDYKLCGVTMLVKTGASRQGVAVIEHRKTGKQWMYQPGDELAGARIARIDKNSVTLLAGGRKYVLPLEMSSSSGRPAPGPVPDSEKPQTTRHLPPPNYDTPDHLPSGPTREEAMKEILQKEGTGAH